MRNVLGGLLTVLIVLGLPLKSSAQLSLTPNLGRPLAESSSIAWCPSFQLAWDTAADSLGVEALLLEDAPASAADLNSFEWDVSEVMPVAGTYASAGLTTEEALRTVRNDLFAKFGQDAESIRLPDAGGEEDKLFALAVLIHRIQFTRPLYRSKTVGMEFSEEQGSEPVSFFGVKGNAVEKFTIPILEWRDEDNFTLLLKTKSGDGVVLTKGERPSDLAEAVEQQRHLILEPTAPPEGFLAKVCVGDALQIPYLNCSIEKDFDEFIEKKILLDSKMPYRFADVYQTLDFKLDERGAEVRSVAGSIADPFGPGDLPEKSIRPRSFIFDKPFHLSIWQSGAEYPYLSIWVGDSGMMERFVPKA